MTVIRWKDEAIKSDTSYSLEAIEVQEEAANASEGYYTPTLAAHAATGDTGNLAQFKAGVKPEHRFNPGLKASPTPSSPNFTFAPDPKKVAELRGQQAAFEKQVVGAPRLANPGNTTRSRSEQDLVDQLYEEGRTVQKNADTMQEARRRFATDPGDIEAKLHDAATDKERYLDASDHLAMQLLINQRSEEAGNDLSKHAANMALRMAYRIARGDVARALQIGYDRFMKPAERAQAALTEAIYAPTPKVQKVAEKLPAAKRMEFIQRESEKRVAAVEKELKKLGLTIAEISGQKRTLLQRNCF